MNMQPNFKFDLGDEVKDIVTGLTGVVTGRIQWFTGCLGYQITPQVLKDGQNPKTDVINENQLELVQHNKVTPGFIKAVEEKRPVGGACDINVEAPGL